MTGKKVYIDRKKVEEIKAIQCLNQNPKCGHRLDRHSVYATGTPCRDCGCQCFMMSAEDVERFKRTD